MGWVEVEKASTGVGSSMKEDWLAVVPMTLAPAVED
jgi:hypothetical protein